MLEDVSEPVVPGTLSHYFYEMSLGNHALIGETVDQVIVSDFPVEDFHLLGGIGGANKHIIEKVAGIYGAEYLAQFDLNSPGGGPDGIVDYVFIHYQSTRTAVEDPPGTWVYYGNLYPGSAAISSLNFTNTLVFEYGDDEEIRVSPHGGCTIQSIRQHPAGQTAMLVRHPWMLRAVAAHEYGHDLLGAAEFIGGCSGHITTESSYGLMNGSMTPPVLMMSGIMRLSLGWLDPPVVSLPSSFPHERTLTLSADYEDGNGCFALVRTHITEPDPPKGSQYFLLEARRPNLPDQVYNTANPTGSEYENCCYPMREVGEGLLIAHVREGGGCCYPLNSPPPQYDLPPPLVSFEVATGLFNLGTGQPDPIGGLNLLLVDSRKQCGAGGLVKGPELGKVGDLFRPMQAGADMFSNMFTPFTNPNTNLYVDEPATIPTAQTVYSGISFYDIEWIENTNDIRVKIRFDDPTNPPVSGGADTLRTSMTCDGLLQLSADLVVAPEASLTLKEGSRLVTTNQIDRLAGGRDVTRVELIPLGQIRAEATEANPIRFMSFRDDEFELQDFRKGWATGVLPDPGPAAPGDWFSVVFDVAGCGCAISGSGLSAGFGPHSRLEHVEIAHAQAGVWIANRQAPSLVDLTFLDILNDRHVYMKSDVYIPNVWIDGADCGGSYVYEPAEWALGPGTNFVAANVSEHDLNCFGETGLVDMFVSGLWAIEGAEGNPVVFRPETITDPNSPAGGNDWGGAFLTFYSDGSSVRYADFGYAENPIFLSYPRNHTITDTRVHHFSGTGIWANGLSGVEGTSLERLTVERQDGSAPLFETLGHTGIFLDRTDGVDLIECKVDMTGRNDASGTKGVRLAQMCSSNTGAGYRTLVVQDNCILGPGINAAFGTNDVGLYANFICHYAQHGVTIDGNTIEGWRKLGGYFDKPSGIRLRRNFITSSRNGIDVFHHSASSGNLYLRENRIEAEFADETLFAYQANRAVRSHLGPDDDVFEFQGLNQLAVNEQETKFVYDADSSTVAHNAMDTYWFTYDAELGVHTQIGTGQDAEISDRLAPVNNAQVNITSFETDPPTWAPLTSCESGSSTIRLPVQMAAQDSPTLVLSPEAGVPVSFSLGRPRPNPSGDAVHLDLAIPSGRIGTYELEVFDVGGRRLFEMSKKIAAPGRYEMRWSGLDGNGKRPGSGIYFLRVTGPQGVNEIRRAVVLR